MKRGLRSVWKLALLFAIGVGLNVRFGSILMLPRYSFLRRTTILIGLVYDIYRHIVHSNSTVIAVIITTLGAFSVSIRHDTLSIEHLWGYLLVLLDNFVGVLQGERACVLT